MITLACELTLVASYYLSWGVITRWQQTPLRTVKCFFHQLWKKQVIEKVEWEKRFLSLHFFCVSSCAIHVVTSGGHQFYYTFAKIGLVRKKGEWGYYVTCICVLVTFLDAFGGFMFKFLWLNSFVGRMLYVVVEFIKMSPSAKLWLGTSDIAMSVMQ